MSFFGLFVYVPLIVLIAVLVPRSAWLVFSFLSWTPSIVFFFCPQTSLVTIIFSIVFFPLPLCLVVVLLVYFWWAASASFSCSSLKLIFLGTSDDSHTHTLFFLHSHAHSKKRPVTPRSDLWRSPPPFLRVSRPFINISITQKMQHSTPNTLCISIPLVPPLSFTLSPLFAFPPCCYSVFYQTLSFRPDGRNGPVSFAGARLVPITLLNYAYCYLNS